MNESKRYDCSRGCTVERNESGEVDCSYRQGCCKLEVYDWLSGVNQEQYKDYCFFLEIEWLELAGFKKWFAHFFVPLEE